MSLLTAVLFFVYTWGLGFAITRLVKESESFIERNIMRVGFGLSAFVVLGIILNALHIPIDYRIFLLASVAAPLYYLVFKKGHRQLPKLSLKLTVSNLYFLAVLVVFLFSLFMYESGAFRYPYLEDDDPWGHASAAKYVSVEKTVHDSPYLNFQYMDPYPPGYDMALGILSQTASSVYWVLKFFNALLISLSVLFFYFFAKEFMASRGKALFATFVLASVPAYLSHFIWAPALAMAVFFQAMYSLEMIKHDKRWLVVAAVCFASVLLAHPTHAVKLSSLIAIYVGIKLFSSFVSDRTASAAADAQRQPRVVSGSWLRQNVGYVAAAAGGVALSLFWWAFKLAGFASLAKGGLRGGTEAAAEAIKSSGNIVTKFLTLITKVLNAEGGTATRVYQFTDFVIVHSANMINNPVGFGLVASLLVLAGVVAAVLKFAAAVPKRKIVVGAVFLVCFVLTFMFLRISALQLVLTALLAAFVLAMIAVALQKEKSLWLPVTLGWLLFAFLGVNSLTFNLPIGLFAFRFWMILAVPVAILAAEGFFALLSTISMFRLDKSTATVAKAILIIIIVAGIFFTSTKQKYDVNTACWPAGAFWSGSLVLEPSSGCPVPSEVVAYSWLATLPQGSKVFTFSNPDQVIAYGHYSCGWCRADREIKSGFSNVTASGLHGFMKANSYEYVVVGGIEARGFGLNQTVRLINEVSASQLFTVAHQAEAAIFFRAN